MQSSFENSFDDLLKSVVSSPEEESWFFPAVRELILKTEKDEIIGFISSEKATPYLISILVKAGFIAFDFSVLHKYLNLKDEDEVYDVALSLAICNQEKGIKVLYQFANKTHKLSKYISPIHDMLDDVKYLNKALALDLTAFIKSNN